MPTTRTVTIVETDEAVLDALALLLELEGFEPIALRSPAGLDAADPSLEGTCLVIDIDLLRGEDDLRFLERLLRRRPALGFVGTTRAIDSAERAAPLFADVTVLEKPFGRGEIVPAILREFAAMAAAH